MSVEWLIHKNKHPEAHKNAPQGTEKKDEPINTKKKSKKRCSSLFKRNPDNA